MKNPVINRSIEYNDNRISKYIAQKGLLYHRRSTHSENMELHHIVPKAKGGNDKYDNLVL